jgi:UPF0716 family protein affecting phage T7 exclusion
VVLGALRAYHLGRKRYDLAEDTAARGRERRRHLVFGAVWVAMGLFLLISTAINLR